MPHPFNHIGASPLAQQMEFNSRLLMLNDDADIMEELKGLTPEQLKAATAMRAAFFVPCCLSRCHVL